MLTYDYTMSFQTVYDLSENGSMPVNDNVIDFV